MQRPDITILILAILAVSGFVYASHGTSPTNNAETEGYHDTLYADHLEAATSTNLIKIMERVHVNDDTATSSQFSINAPAGTDPLRVRTDGSTKLLVGSNGGVSIGTYTTPPSDGLHVQGMVRAQAGLQGDEVGNTGKRAVVTPYVVQDSARCAWDSVKGQCRADNTASASCNSGDYIGEAQTVSGDSCLDKTTSSSCEGTTFETEYQSCMSVTLN